MLIQLLDQLQKKAASLGMVQRTAINTVINMIPRQEIYLHDHRIGLLVECIINKDHAQIDNFCEAYDIPTDNDLRKIFHRLALGQASKEELEIRKQKEQEVMNKSASVDEDETEEIIPIQQRIADALNVAAKNDATLSEDEIPTFMTEAQYKEHIKQRKSEGY